MKNNKTGLPFEIETPELEEMAAKVYASTMEGAKELLATASMLNKRDDILVWAKAVKQHFDEHQEAIIAIRVLNANLLDGLKKEE
jgi:hypothetical protein